LPGISTTGAAACGLRILGETPLRKRLGVLARVFEPTGKARLDLDIAIPLGKRHRDSLRITGELGWPGPATLAIPDQGILLTGLAGSLHFTARNLQARSIEARLWGVPVRLGVATCRSGKEATVTTRILVTGRFPAAVLARQFPAQAWGLLQGRTHLALALRLTEADLGGSVAALDLRPWLDWWADHKGPGTGDSGGGATLRSAQVRVGRLSLPATTLNEVRFELDDQGRS